MMLGRGGSPGNPAQRRVGRFPGRRTAGVFSWAPMAAVMVLAAALGACTAAEGERSGASAQARFARFPHSMANSACFFSSRIDNFEVLNDTNLLVSEGRRRIYHVEISPPSNDLRHAYGVQFSSSTGRVCGNPGERLLTRNGSFGSFPSAVVGVYRLDEANELAVRAHFGQAPALPAAPEDEDAEAIEELVTEIDSEEDQEN